MPEIENNQAADDGTEDHSADKDENSQAGAEKNTDAAKTGNEDAGDGEDQGGEGDKDTSKGKEDAKAPNESSKEGEDKTEDKDQEEEDDGKEPPVRQRLSKQDFIIGRQKRKLAKKKEAQDDDNEDAGEDEDDVSPEDQAMIQKVVAKQFAPLIDKSLSADDNAEVVDFLKENPDFKQFEAKVRRFMKHPSRRQLPIKSIFYEVAGKQLLKMGAKRKAEADEKAKNSQTGGGSNRAGEGAKSAFDLSDEEFADEQERVRRGQ